ESSAPPVSPRSYGSRRGDGSLVLRVAQRPLRVSRTEVVAGHTHCTSNGLVRQTSRTVRGTPLRLRSGRDPACGEGRSRLARGRACRGKTIVEKYEPSGYDRQNAKTSGSVRRTGAFTRCGTPAGRHP